MLPTRSSRRLRRPALAALSVLVALPAAALLAPSPATADDSRTLTVLGTSDVFDSNLVQSVIKPGFESQNPGVTLNYVSSGTGVALDNARKGNGSAAIVHAAALENQFVSEGFSLEPAGRAVFWGDYILAGPASDPAGVLNGSTHDIVTAFQKVAAAGAAGTANFVSRGGTPGTTIQEHAIWALTSGVPTCNVPAGARGGGKTPSKDNINADCPTTVNIPDWYKSTGASQAANVQNADVCNYSVKACYVFTDRGTFNFLQSTNRVPNLKEMVRNNASTAPGGPDLLVNSFHAYVVNPAKVPANANLNPALATKFLDFLTDPNTQTAIGNYLKADPPFLPSAAPAVSATPLPASVASGLGFTVTGSLKNVVPGTPVLDNVPVTLVAKPAGIPGAPYVTAAVGATNAAGAFALTYKPVVPLDYAIQTSQITKVEVPTLTPVFTDLLTATTKPIGTVNVINQLAVTQVQTLGRGRLLLKGTVAPTTGGQKGKVKVYAGNGKKLKLAKKVKLKPGATKFRTVVTGLRGNVKYYVKYQNPGVVTTSSPTDKVKF